MSPRSRASDVALWVGCYTSDMYGTGEGIIALSRAADGRLIPLDPATRVTSPSFLALHPTRPVLYAVSEGDAMVHAFRFDADGTLGPLGASGTASELACHVAVDPDGGFLVVSCWGDGSVLVFELDPGGSIGRRHAAPASVDPSGDARQSRAHSCLMLGDGRFVTAEMGHDLLRCWSFSAEHGLEPHGAVELAHDCGPRHFARSSAGIVYVNTEYSGEVLTLALTDPAGGRPWLELRGGYPLMTGGVRPGDAAAEICLDRAGRNLYVGVRGSDVICRLALDGDGVPSAAEAIPRGGTWPRHHCLDGDRLVVALERSHALATFALDAEGQPVRPPELVATGSPTCVLPAP